MAITRNMRLVSGVDATSNANVIASGKANEK